MTTDPLIAARKALGDDAQTSSDADSVTARLDGVTVTIRYALHGAGSYSERWTEVDGAVVHRGLELSLRAQTADEDKLIKQGLAIDLQTNDPAFDAAYVVEAAPSDVVHALLDAEVRRDLLALPGVDVTTVPHGIRLQQLDWIEDIVRLKAMAALASRFAQKVPEAWRDAEAGATATYRTSTTDDAARIRRKELASLELVRENRKIDGLGRGCLLVIAIAIVGFLVNLIGFWLTQ